MSATMYMRRCLELAETSRLAGDTAVGALIVCGEDVVGEGIERTRATLDPSAHAEIEAIRQACQRLETLDLRGCSLYSTVEPCVLCGYAIRRTGIAHIVYGAPAGQAGACTSSYAILADRDLDGWPQVPEVTSGVLADECLAALRRRPRARVKTRPIMDEITHRTINTNGIRMHVAEQGTGPLVILCHGFPESWYSWRHQLAALAAAGFHAVAADMRGYGQTDAPEEIEAYTLLHLVGDMVGLVGALGEKSAVIAGHDWGAPVAWHAALLRPDVFRGVIGLSVPFRPRASMRPTSVMPTTDEAMFYQLYFQTPGVAEAELERDVRSTIRRLAYAASGDSPAQGNIAMVPRRGGLLAQTTDPDTLPPWLTAADIDFYAAEFSRTGFRGALNWYRNIDRNWELLAPFTGAVVTVPALYIAGDRDLVVRFPGMEQLIANLSTFVPHLRRTIMLPGCGHWTQQERAREVNDALLEFLEAI